jgi:hypothetical protein
VRNEAQRIQEHARAVGVVRGDTFCKLLSVHGFDALEREPVYLLFGRFLGNRRICLGGETTGKQQQQSHCESGEPAFQAALHAARMSKGRARKRARPLGLEPFQQGVVACGIGYPFYQPFHGR